MPHPRTARFLAALALATALPGFSAGLPAPDSVAAEDVAPPATAPTAVAAVESATLPVTVPTPDLTARVNGMVEKLKDQATRKSARADIIALGSEATPALLTRMKDPDFTVRWEAANVQGDIRDPRALPALVENVVRDPDPHIRWRSMWAINQYPDRAAAVEILRRDMASSDETTRWNAAVGLSMLGVREALPVLHAGITQADSWRRWEAINALSRMHDETSVKALEPVVLRAPDVRERDEAVLALARIGGEEAVTLLVKALEDPVHEVRWRAAMGLGAVGDRRAVEPLKALHAKETNAQVREHVERALAALGSPLADPSATVAPSPGR